MRILKRPFPLFSIRDVDFANRGVMGESIRFL